MPAYVNASFREIAIRYTSSAQTGKGQQQKLPPPKEGRGSGEPQQEELTLQSAGDGPLSDSFAD